MLSFNVNSIYNHHTSRSVKCGSVSTSFSTKAKSFNNIKQNASTNKKYLLQYNPSNSLVPYAVGSQDNSSINEHLTKEQILSIDNIIKDNKVVVFMKGTKDFPLCGFSNAVVQIFNNLNVPFVDINILDSDSLRNGMKIYSQWPTFPQIYIKGDFYGGCDILKDAFFKGQLQIDLQD